MAALLSPADSEAVELLREVLQEHHPDLVEAGVTINLLFANAKAGADGEVKGPALKLHGYPCLATVKINSLKDRIEGKKDATIELDGDVWHEHAEARKKAIHLVVAREKDGSVKLDDAGRPKLKMRLHDMVVGGFTEVLERHGQEHAGEADHVKALFEQLRQLELFPLG